MAPLQEAEVIEPLLPTIRANLEHRHSYVRRNAALALWTIFKVDERLVQALTSSLQNHDMLVPDAADVLSTFLMAVSATYSPRGSLAKPSLPL
jgi:coatomer subunit beta